MSILYHYCSPSSFTSIISSKAIWLSSLSLSNDAAEGKVIHDAFSRLFKRESLLNRTIELVLDQIQFLDRAIDGLGFCLSEKGDLLSQWRGYAQDGEGFAIGFSSDYLDQLGKAQEAEFPGFRTLKVIYDEKEQEEVLMPAFTSILKLAKAGLLEPPMPKPLLGSLDSSEEPLDPSDFKKARDEMFEIIIGLMGQQFALKNSAFSEEKEHRLISYLVKRNDSRIQFRARSNKVIPYRSYELKNLGIQPIAEIIVGPKNMTPDFIILNMLERVGSQEASIIRSSATYQ